MGLRTEAPHVRAHLAMVIALRYGSPARSLEQLSTHGGLS